MRSCAGVATHRAVSARAVWRAHESAHALLREDSADGVQQAAVGERLLWADDDQRAVAGRRHATVLRLHARAAQRSSGCERRRVASGRGRLAGHPIEQQRGRGQSSLFSVASAGRWHEKGTHSDRRGKKRMEKKQRRMIRMETK
eukprot:3881563-Pleurochrysis_carterae.AAC.1